MIKFIIRWSKNRQTTEDSLNEPIGESSNMQRFCNLKRSRRTSQPEEAKIINCCGTFSYQSNKQLDSNCLETYQYDHSIYFKTIGDIRSDKKDTSDQSKDNVSISSEELVEWDSSSLIDLIADKSNSEEYNNNNHPSKLNASNSVTDQEDNKEAETLSPIVDLSKLDLNPTESLQKEDERLSRPTDKNNFERNDRQQENNNVDNSEVDKEDGSKCQGRIKRFRSFRKTKRSPKNMQRPSIVGENNVVWPGILLNYTNNSFDVINNRLRDP